jgi:hypothetical protein
MAMIVISMTAAFDQQRDGVGESGPFRSSWSSSSIRVKGVYCGQIIDPFESSDVNPSQLHIWPALPLLGSPVLF